MFDVAVTVHPARATLARPAPMAYGLNAFRAFQPGVNGSPVYRRNLAVMAPGLIRLHRWDMIAESSQNPSGWATRTDTTAPGWDRERIRASLTGVYPRGTRLMMNIPGWPPAMADAKGRLRPGLEDAYARWCAELVRIVNVENPFAVPDWEVTNERDDLYDGNGAALGRIYAKCAAAMRAVDPAIRLGGPAFARPDKTANVEAFLRSAGPDLGFVSYHSYVSGSKSDPDAAVWDRAEGLGEVTRTMKATIRRVLGRDLPTFHDEYNISWNPPDPRMNDARGAVFDALALVSIRRAEPAGACAWNEADGWYGKLGPDLRPRPSAYVFALFNARMRGPELGADSSAPKAVGAMASRGATGDTVVLVNRSGEPQRILLRLAEPRRSATVELVGGRGLVRSALPKGPAPTLNLGVHEIAFVTFGAAPSPLPAFDLTAGFVEPGLGG